MIDNEIESRVFKDINFFPDDMKILILGSFPIPLYSQVDKFNTLPKDKKENAWYYSSSRSEFWKLIYDSFQDKIQEEKSFFIQNKKLKKELFTNNKVGIADVFLKCRRKDKNSSKDTDLIIVEYNKILSDVLLSYNTLKLIIFTSRFTENHFFKIINNIDYSILDSFDVNNIYNNKLSNEIISSIRERIIRVNNNKVKIATLTLKRSPIKGITLYSTKRELYSYYLNLYN